MSANDPAKSESTASQRYRGERTSDGNRQPTGTEVRARDTAWKKSSLRQRPKSVNSEDAPRRSRAASTLRVPARRPDAQHTLPPGQHQLADREPPTFRSLWEISFVECLLTSSGFVVAGILILAFGLDLLTGIPFHRHSVLMDVGTIICASLLAYLSWHTYRGLH